MVRHLIGLNGRQRLGAGVWRRAARLLTSLILLGLGPPTGLAQSPAMPPSADALNAVVVQAREALRRGDRVALAAARDTVLAAHHPLAMWVDYWDLSNRLADAQQSDLDAFYARWPGTYVEDRLRNDWLLELGRRRDWVHFRAEYPRFILADDRQLNCYWLVTQQLDGQPVRSAALAAWTAMRDPDDGCALLGRTLVEAQVFTPDDIWHQVRLATEFDRPEVARAVAGLISDANARALKDIFANPVRYLKHRPDLSGATGHQLALLALMRAAAADPDMAADLISQTWRERLPLAVTATAWAELAKQAALKLMPRAADDARLAWTLWDAASKPGTPPPWGEDLLAWQVRAALRQPDSDRQRWPLALRAMAAMGPALQQEPVWVYWKARAVLASAQPGPAGEADRAAAREALDGIASRPSFYGNLAAEALGAQVGLPPAPAPLTQAELAEPRAQPGLVRGLQLIALGLRSEGVREWNFSLRKLPERGLLAAAQWACEREFWDRCISASERTRGEIDMAQRYPLPFREQVLALARANGIDPAVAYALIRQESRFVLDARSQAGAGGLMQIMPGTARWTAHKIGLPFTPSMLADRDTNLQLGLAYFKRVLDDFGNSLPLAAAAYNAGPNRLRRWRASPAVVEPAAWAESIPFNETRGYVENVLANSVYYRLMLGGPPSSLKERLGPSIGPREPAGASQDRDIP
jgi:soluble lytic murein transglycosylase